MMDERYKVCMHPTIVCDEAVEVEEVDVVLRKIMNKDEEVFTIPLGVEDVTLTTRAWTKMDIDRKRLADVVQSLQATYGPFVHATVQAYIQEQCSAIAAEYGYPLARVEAACQKVCASRVETCNQTLSALRSGDPQLRAQFLSELAKP